MVKLESGHGRDDSGKTWGFGGSFFLSFKRVKFKFIQVFLTHRILSSTHNTQKCSVNINHSRCDLLGNDADYILYGSYK